MILERVDVRIDGGYDIPLPRMVKIEQHFKREKLDDIEATVRQEMGGKLKSGEYAGKRIAVAVGSRGIANLSTIVASVIGQLKAWGAHPFIVPAMGSHGGATAEGQTKVLAGYGITEKSMGVPIVSSMDVVQIATLENGMPVYLDKHAYGANGIVVINRVKPHTDFKGDYESGILKMMGIGLGKHRGATTIHSYGIDRFHELIPQTGEAILRHAPIAFAVAILENAYDETAKIEVLPRDRIMEREKELLAEAKKKMPKFLLSSIDVLIVEEIGKDISGAGMDPNVTGRTGSGLPGFPAPPIQKIVVLGLTEKTHGNACGIGLADVTTIRCVKQIDFSYLYANSITSTVLEPAKIPVVMNNDKEAIVVALKTCNRITPETAKIVRIKNTLELHRIEVSEAFLDEIRGREEITILSEPQPMRFTEDGRLL
ncbi:lactate racemase domain-containing protein [Bacillaceae bacterium]